MLDSRRERERIIQKQEPKDTLIDLASQQQTPRYVCSDCTVELLLYPQAAIDFPMERGPHYICPQCHMLVDTAMNKPPGLEDIQPLNTNPVSFFMANEDKGSLPNAGSFQEPDPQDDQWLKNIGATLISKTVIVQRDV